MATCWPSEQDSTHVKELIDQASDGGYSVDSDPVLAKIRTAATAAGSTAGLSDEDFARFRTLIEEVDALAQDAKVLDDGTTMSLSATRLVTLSKAVKAVHRLCY